MIVFPTSISLMRKFVAGKITERRMFELTKKSGQPGALYLYTALTTPRHRRKGYAIGLLQAAVNEMSKERKMKLFAWAFSKEGDALIKGIESVLRAKVCMAQWPMTH